MLEFSRALLGLNEETAKRSYFTVESFDNIKPASSLSDLSRGTEEDVRFQPFQVLTSSNKQARTLDMVYNEDSLKQA